MVSTLCLCYIMELERSKKIKFTNKKQCVKLLLKINSVFNDIGINSSENEYIDSKITTLCQY